uniref:SFRICE_030835 n=1 Tax=Spodoptera frugiperda TaxID=7108 RepID=A0A2H1VQ47_SPOFR
MTHLMISTLCTSLLYVKRNRNESTIDALISWFIRAGQSERRTRSRFDYFKLFPTKTEAASLPRMNRGQPIKSFASKALKLRGEASMTYDENMSIRKSPERVIPVYIITRSKPIKRSDPKMYEKLFDSNGMILVSDPSVIKTVSKQDNVKIGRRSAQAFLKNKLILRGVAGAVSALLIKWAPRATGTRKRA